MAEKPLPATWCRARRGAGIRASVLPAPSGARRGLPGVREGEGARRHPAEPGGPRSPRGSRRERSQALLLGGKEPFPGTLLGRASIPPSARHLASPKATPFSRDCICEDACRHLGDGVGWQLRDETRRSSIHLPYLSQYLPFSFFRPDLCPRLGVPALRQDQGIASHGK